MIDSQGFRLNVGFVISGADNRLLWAKRVGQEAWQFPQGGVALDETWEQTLYRELEEEIGLLPHQVEIVGALREWVYYALPARYVRRQVHPVCLGQKQRWFLLRLVADPACVSLNHAPRPEFDAWRWVQFWYPLFQVIPFKREVYRQVLQVFSGMLFGGYRDPFRALTPFVSR